MMNRAGFIYIVNSKMDMIRMKRKALKILIF